MDADEVGIADRSGQRVEFLAMLRYWLVSGGMMTRSACGNDHEAQLVRSPEAERERRLGLTHG